MANVPMQAVPFLFSLAILVMSVVIHEVSHGTVAYFLGDPTAKLAGRLTLNPLKHIDPVGSILVPIITSFAGFTFGWAKPVPYNPYNLQAGRWGPAIVAAAGPLSNLLLALIFGTILRLQILSGPTTVVLTLIVFVNIILAVFNLIPIPPLDGSKVLFSALPYEYRHVETFLTQNYLLLIVLLLAFGGNIVAFLATKLFFLITGGSLFL